MPRRRKQIPAAGHKWAHLEGVLPKGPERGPLSPRDPFGKGFGGLQGGSQRADMAVRAPVRFGQHALDTPTFFLPLLPQGRNGARRGGAFLNSNPLSPALSALWRGEGVGGGIKLCPAQTGRLHRSCSGSPPGCRRGRHPAARNNRSKFSEVCKISRPLSFRAWFRRAGCPALRQAGRPPLRCITVPVNLGTV